MFSLLWLIPSQLARVFACCTASWFRAQGPPTHVGGLDNHYEITELEITIFLGGDCALSFNKFFTRYFPARNRKAFVFLPVLVQNLVKMTNATCFSSFHQNLVNFLSESCGKLKKHRVFTMFRPLSFLILRKAPYFYVSLPKISPKLEKNSVFLLLSVQHLIAKNPRVCSICPKIP